MSWRVKRKVCGDAASALEASAGISSEEDSRSPVRENVWAKYLQSKSESDSNDNDASGKQSEVDEIITELNAAHVEKPKKKRKNRKRANKNAHIESKENDTETGNTSNSDNTATNEAGTSSSYIHSANSRLTDINTNQINRPSGRIRENDMERAPEFRSLKVMLKFINLPLPSGARRFSGPRMHLVTAGEVLNVLETASLIRGLHMVLYKEERGLKYFVLQYSSSYAKSHKIFMRAPAEHHTDNHLGYNALLLENMIKFIGLTTEENIIENYLDGGFYQIEHNFHKQFNLTDLNIRLPYSNIENRSFFILLFIRAIRFKITGAYRSALEISKLAINLDHSDPLLFIILIDYFAMEAREYSWYVEFVKEWIRFEAIEWMPNVIYSMALAHYRTAMNSGGNIAAAEFYVKKGLLTYPMILLPLLRKCGLKKTLDEHMELVTSKFFNEFDTDLSPVVSKLCEMYIMNNFTVWLSEKALKWLIKNAVEALEMVNNNHKDVEYFANIRKKVQHTQPLSLKRHIFLNKLVTSYTDHSETCPWNPYPPNIARDAP